MGFAYKRQVIFCAGRTEKDEHRTSNVQHRPSEIEKKFHGVKMMNEKTNSFALQSSIFNSQSSIQKDEHRPSEIENKRAFHPSTICRSYRAGGVKMMNGKTNIEQLPNTRTGRWEGAEILKETVSFHRIVECERGLWFFKKRFPRLFRRF